MAAPNQSLGSIRSFQDDPVNKHIRCSFNLLPSPQSICTITESSPVCDFINRLNSQVPYSNIVSWITRLMAKGGGGAFPTGGPAFMLPSLYNFKNVNIDFCKARFWIKPYTNTLGFIGVQKYQNCGTAGGQWNSFGLWFDQNASGQTYDQLYLSDYLDTILVCNIIPYTSLFPVKFPDKFAFEFYDVGFQTITDALLMSAESMPDEFTYFSDMALKYGSTGDFRGLPNNPNPISGDLMKPLFCLFHDSTDVGANPSYQMSCDGVVIVEGDYK